MNKIKLRQFGVISPFIVLPLITLLFANPFTYLSNNETTNIIKQTIMILLLIFAGYKFIEVTTNKYKFSLNKILSDLGFFLALYFSYSNLPSLFRTDSPFPIWFNIMYIWPTALGLILFIYYGEKEYTMNKLIKNCSYPSTAKLTYKEQSAVIINSRLTYNLTLEFQGYTKIIKNVSNQIALNISTGDSIKIKYNPRNKREFILA